MMYTAQQVAEILAEKFEHEVDWDNLSYNESGDRARAYADWYADDNEEDYIAVTFDISVSHAWSPATYYNPEEGEITWTLTDITFTEGKEFINATESEVLDLIEKSGKDYVDYWY